jgi:hypothetical protein
MKPNKTFKLSKTTKRRMATIVDANERHGYKRMMINAELSAGVAPRPAKDRNAK